jgi:GT2 family glycosyltransferase
MDSDRLKELAFDFYERYILLESIEKIFRPREAPYRVLDVGGHTPAFWPGFCSIAGTLIPDASVAVVDVHAQAELKNYIQATGLALPFPDDSFDLVCSLDTLEHIPGEDRPAFLAELLRVTRDGLYVAFPFDSPSNRWAESILTEYTSVLLNDPVPALLEHRHFGLPDRAGIAAWLASGPYSWIGFEQGNTDVWLLMMLTYHSLRMPGMEFVQELNRRFNEVYAAQDWAAPAYRTGYVLSKRHRPADLQELRASLGSPEKRADLQGVLAFCQLFLNIAQNGRVTVDKDRHIRNIDQELVDAREKLRTHLETAAAERETLRAELDRTQLALSQKQLENSELSGSISQIATQLEKLPKQIAGLQGAVEALASQSARSSSTHLESQARLDGRMRQLEIGLVTNKRAIQAIYDSRIWKTLSGLGGLALRWAGRGTNHRGSTGIPDHGAPWSQQPAAATGEFIALVCDYPGTRGIVPVCNVVEIRGWALARSGIERVLIQFNDGPPATAVYGILRQDVGRKHKEIAGSDYSGYRFFWDTAGLPEGPCTVRITAVAHSGRAQELVSSVTVDWNSSPGYDLWIARNEPAVEEKLRMRAEVDKFTIRPRISIAIPVYKTPIAILTRCLRSVTDQIYPNWELCLADDASGDPAIAALLQEHARRDPRIRATVLPENLGISGATNEALSIATGDYIAFLDHDDELADFALWEAVRAINESPDTDLFYSDEDKIDQSGRRYDAFFKPDWSPDLFLSCNYICHFVVLKRSLLDRLGGLNESYNGAQDYEFLLRAIEHTRKIKRIPRVLYHWGAIAGSTAKASAGKPHASIDGKRALSSYLTRTAPGATVEVVKTCRYRVRYPIAGNPRVTILMPTNGQRNLFRAALEDVLEKTSYKNYDIVLIDNSRTARIEEYVAGLARKAPVSYFDWRGRPFNFSLMNNAAARTSQSPYILFLNDDITVIAAEWLTAMLEHAQHRDVGAVGAQLWYPNDAIQHAGVIMGLYGNCSHAFKNLAAGRPHYFDFPDLIRNCSAVTAACLLIGRDKFFQAGGFDEANLAIAFQDVDLCLKLLELGYRNVYTPYAKLYHHESATKSEKEKIPDQAEDAFVKRKWARYIADDPYYNPNLARRSEDFSLGVE